MPVHSPVTILGSQSSFCCSLAVGVEGMDRTLGEQRVQRERHVRRREHLLNAMPTVHGKPPPPYSGSNAMRTPAAIDDTAGTASANPSGVVTEPSSLRRLPLDIAGAVRRGNDFSEEAASFDQEVWNDVEPDVGERAQLGQVVDAYYFAKRELHVAGGCVVFSQGSQLFLGPVDSAVRRWDVREQIAMVSARLGLDRVEAT